MIEWVSPQDFDCDIITPRDNNMDTARGLLQETQSPRDELIQQKDQEIEQIVTPEPHMKLFDPWAIKISKFKMPNATQSEIMRTDRLRFSENGLSSL